MAREMVRLPGLDAPYPLPIGFAVGRIRGRESFSGGDKGRELVGCVESAMMRRPLHSTNGPRTRSSKGSERLIRPPTDRLAVVVAADGSELLTGHCPIEVESRIELELHP